VIDELTYAILKNDDGDRLVILSSAIVWLEVKWNHTCAKECTS